MNGSGCLKAMTLCSKRPPVLRRNQEATAVAVHTGNWHSVAVSRTLRRASNSECDFPRMAIALAHDHEWDVSPDEAKQIQQRLAPEVAETALSDDIDTVAGVDVSIRDDRAQAAVAVLQLPDLNRVDEAVHRCEVPFPYVPGLLSFRETPPVLRALDQLAEMPDVLMTDSHGLAHPRRFGFACHLGVLLDHPTLGVAKSILVGTPKGTLAPQKGDHVPLVDDGATIGRVLRTRTEVNPVYVSIGHRITLPAATALTLDCSPRYKIPEPTRQAHKLSRSAD